MTVELKNNISVKISDHHEYGRGYTGKLNIDAYQSRPYLNGTGMHHFGKPNGINIETYYKKLEEFDVEIKNKESIIILTPKKVGDEKQNLSQITISFFGEEMQIKKDFLWINAEWKEVDKDWPRKDGRRVLAISGFPDVYLFVDKLPEFPLKEFDSRGKRTGRFAGRTAYYI